MKFDARTEHSPEKKEAFLAWFTSETISTFVRSRGDPEGLKTAAFLFVNRAREAGIPEADIAKVLGISVARASLSSQDEGVVLDRADALDPLAEAVFSRASRRKPWWRFWS